MMKEKIKIVENGIYIDIEQLKKIIISAWQSGNLYKANYAQGIRGESLYRVILSDLDDLVDEFIYETKMKIQKKLGLSKARLDWWLDRYPKSDARSIGFEVVDKLTSGWSTIENLTTDDIPAILEFLDTPPDKSLEAWDKWEKYWASLDYPERRKKLLKNAEQ